MSAGPRLQLRDAVRKLVPPWLSDRGPSFASVGFKWLFSVAAVGDAIIEWAVQGAQAQLPGLGTPTVFPELGRARGIRRGLAETDEAYAVRLADWLRTLKHVGHPFEICRQIRAYFGEDIKVRVVDFSGNWHSILPGGEEVRHNIPGSWNWDGSPDYFWAQGHVIIYAPAGWAEWTAFYDSDPTLWGGDLTGYPYTLGQTTPYDVAEDIRAIVRAVKPSHMKVREIIVSFDDALFDPDDNTTWPDGTWGTYTAGEPQAKTRPEDARYWEGVM